MLKEDQFPSDAQCPKQTVWLAVVEGEIEASSAERLLAHAGGCAACADELRHAIAALGRDDEEPVEELTAAKRRQLAAAMAKGAGRRWFPGPRVLSIAAAIVIGVLAGSWWLRVRRSAEASLTGLARVYTAHRSIEPRIAGAAWGPIRVERSAGSLAEAPSQLLEALSQIKARLGSKTESALWFQAQCRAEVLLGSFDAALAACGSAEATGARGDSFWIDYANVYFERAESTGRQADYASCISLLDRVIANHPADSAARFNRAIALERSGDLKSALSEYESALRFETDPGWTAEIRDRAARLGSRDRP
jgi:tetratricopeptide (TPR) repeat protein